MKWLRIGWWAFTHPFSGTWENPGVQDTLERYADQVRTIERARLVEEIVAWFRSRPLGEPAWDFEIRADEWAANCIELQWSDPSVPLPPTGGPV